MTPNISKVSATVGTARFEAEGPAEVVLAQFAHFLKSRTSSLAAAPEGGPVPPGVYLLQRFITIGVPTGPSPAQPPAARFITRWGPGQAAAPEPAPPPLRVRRRSCWRSPGRG